MANGAAKRLIRDHYYDREQDTASQLVVTAISGSYFAITLWPPLQRFPGTSVDDTETTTTAIQLIV